MIKQNLHTHSLFCDGKNSIEEIVNEAIKKNFSILGFSSHGEINVDGVSKIKHADLERYKEEVKMVKDKYKSQINIFLGIEEDVAGERYLEGFDYIIGSCHLLGNMAIDNSKKGFVELFNDKYKGNIYTLVKDYFKEISKLCTYKEVDIIGHLDLYSKYNEEEEFFNFSDQKYLSMVYKMVDEIILSNKIIEINTGAIARGHRKSAYPHKNILEYMAKKNAKIILNSDCHDKDFLDCAYLKTIELLEKIGFKEIMVLTENGFVSKSITEFR